MSTHIDFRVLHEGGSSVTDVLWDGDVPKAGQIIAIQVDNLPREVQIVEVWPAALVANKLRIAIDCRITGDNP